MGGGGGGGGGIFFFFPPKPGPPPEKLFLEKIKKNREYGRMSCQEISQSKEKGFNWTIFIIVILFLL